MRLIDADALMESIGCADAVKYGNRDRAQQDISYRTMMLYEIRDEIDAQPTVGGWISVKDRMPEIDKDVLILYESNVLHETGYAITCLKDSFYFGSTPIPYSTPQWREPWQYFRENNVVTHWMPLPEPPKEEEGNL